MTKGSNMALAALQLAASAKALLEAKQALDKALLLVKDIELYGSQTILDKEVDLNGVVKVLKGNSSLISGQLLLLKEYGVAFCNFGRDLCTREDLELSMLGSLTHGNESSTTSDKGSS
jgi:hypothetical protein